MTSPIRPDQNLTFALIETRTVKNSVTVTRGMAVKATTTDHEVDASGSGDPVCGIVLDDSVVGDGVKTCQVVMGGGIVPVIVGTGGASQGAFAVVVADGLTDKTLGGGTTLRHVAGMFTQTGVAGDLVGLRIAPFDGVSA